ncbi:aminoglycoside phosphotransferase [Pedococcus sp. KACC 23699]|uniref:Aminoglycoside phosphotransferase n=1 Tax=Pedococcus sp. KACC 23699 TaxID=3149228 RepID=A0AAU7JWK4_9MICO
MTTAGAPPVPDKVLDLFAVPDDVRPLAGGRGGSVVAGDLVLSPGRDAATQDWLSPVLARQAVALDLEPARAVRIAMPIPAREGSWVVDGWAASRYEPDTTACTDLDVLVATGRLLHARLAVAVPQRPAGLDTRTDRWAEADRLVWGPIDALAAAVARQGSGVADGWVAELRSLAGTGSPPARSEQLVHGDLAGNVLLDATGTPVVIDLAPYWRSPLWAEAVCVLDAVTWHGADPTALEHWHHGEHREAMLRARLFRLLSDPQ